MQRYHAHGSLAAPGGVDLLVESWMLLYWPLRLVQSGALRLVKNYSFNGPWQSFESLFVVGAPMVHLVGYCPGRYGLGWETETMSVRGVR